MHGVGEWNPKMISISYQAFLMVIEKLEDLSKGREFPVRMEEKPMTQKEYDEFMQSVVKTAQPEYEDFWALLISDEDAGVGVF